MPKVSLTSLVVLCAALAACSDGVANRAVTTPEVAPALDVGPAFSEAPADLRLGMLRAQVLTPAERAALG